MNDKKKPIARAPRPFPLRCRECGQMAVEIAEIDYPAEVRHDGRLHAFTASGLRIPVCKSCDARVFTADVDEQINNGPCAEPPDWLDEQRFRSLDSRTRSST